MESYAVKSVRMRRTFVLFVSALSLAACKAKEVPSGTTTTTAASSAPVATGAAGAAANAAAGALANAISPGATAGLKSDEIWGASCDTITLDSECGGFLLRDASKKAKAAEAMTHFCKKGTIATTCPATGIVAACRSGQDRINYYYSSGPKAYDAAAAKAACAKDRGHLVD
jgi:hypothetical protein